MSNKTIEKIWYGKIIPYEQLKLDSDDVKWARDFAMQCHDELFSTLTPEQKTLLEKYEYAQDRATALCEQKSFASGFKLGVNIIIESIEKL